MGRFLRFGALACLYLGAESKALKWQDDTPSWEPPRETIAAMDMSELGFSPNPTAAPDAANVELRLAKRVRGDDTCGYISGESTKSIYCEVGSCVIHSFYSVVGCCNSAAVSDCKIATGCLPSESSRLYATSDTLMLFCSSNAQPECITYVYSGSAFNSYTLYDCAPTATRVVVYANPTDSPSNNGPSTTLVVDSSDTGHTKVTQTITPTPGPTSGTPSSASSAPVGAIVGGVVGGVAAIVLIVFGIIFLVRKNKKDPNNNGQAPPVTYNGPSPAGQQPGQPQMYQTAPSPNGQTPTTPRAFPSGFTPVDNRQSMLKAPYEVTTQGGYDQGGISPPVSPSPTYQSGAPQYQGDGITPPPPQGGYPPPHQMPIQQMPAQQQGGYYNVPPSSASGGGQQGGGYYTVTSSTTGGQQHSPQQTTTTTTTTHHTHHQQSFASELPATRGDGELRELA